MQRGAKRNLWAKVEQTVMADVRKKNKKSPFNFANLMQVRIRAAEEARAEKVERVAAERKRALEEQDAAMRQQIMDVKRELGNLEGEFGPTLQWAPYGPDSFAIQLPRGAGHWHMTQTKLLVIRGANKPFVGIASMAPPESASAAEAREGEAARMRRSHEMYETGERIDKDVMTRKRIEELDWRDGSWPEKSGTTSWLGNHVLDRNKAPAHLTHLDMQDVAPEDLTPMTLENQSAGHNKVPARLASVLEKGMAAPAAPSVDANAGV